MKLPTIRDANIKKGMCVILRADFDVAIKNGRIQDDFRIRETIPTIRYLLRRGAKVLIITKRGHLKIKKSGALSTKLFAPYLEKLLRIKTFFVSNFRELRGFRSSDGGGGVFLFENMRFWPEEESNNPAFASRFAKIADIYVSDNFGAAHRAHASVIGIPRFLPSYAGFLLEKEVRILERVSKNPRRPLVVILGGKKLETKLPLIKKFLSLGGEVLIGGALANTLFHAENLDVGRSVVDDKLAKRLRSILGHRRLFLPIDLVVSEGIEGKVRVVPSRGVKKGEIIYDVGPKTVRLFGSRIERAKTVFWNGPLGFAEFPKFSFGTRGLARSIQKVRAFKVVGGGDTISILKKYRLLRGFSHVSTGGGAMLEFLAGKKLPGLEALKRHVV